VQPAYRRIDRVNQGDRNRRGNTLRGHAVTIPRLAMNARTVALIFLS
jgi:hypothetical protein